MRVQLSLRRAALRDESGAIALLAAFLATGLCVIAAFTVDFGVAYTSKQQLQEAADAGVLSAAQVYKGRNLPCATLAADVTLKSQAQLAADAWAEQNRVGKVGGTVDVTCSGNNLTITYGTSGSTDVGLGQLAGVGDHITTSRVAAATIGKAKPGQLRPWAICSAVTSTSGQVIFVPMKDGSTSNHAPGTTCGAEGPPGGWWIMQCTGQGNGTSDTQGAVADGCSTDGYHAVPGQATTDPAALLAFLKAACPSKATTDTCLASDTGHNFQLTVPQWQTLVGKTFTMPVLCAIPTCSHLAVSGSGNNASYAIQRMATVELCGFKIEGTASTGWPITGPCATANPLGYRASDVLSGTGFFLVIKDLIGGPSGDWSLPEYTAMRLTK